MLLPTALLLAATAPAHPGPPIWGTLLVTDDECVLTLEGEPEPLARNLGFAGPLVGPFRPGEEEAARGFLRRALTAGDLFAVDGAPVVPRVRSITLPVDEPEVEGWLKVEVELELPAAGMPRSVSLSWRDFEATEFEGQRFVPVLIKFPGDIEMISLYPEEPEYVWHSREARPRRPVARPPAAPPVTRGVPLLTVALGALAAALALGWGRSRVGRGGTLALALLAGLGAYAARDSLQVGSLGGGRVPVPTDEQAGEVFDVLLTNLYEAFGSRTEDEIYDNLAASVDAGLIDEIFATVYESLVLREESGAVCSVDDVEILDRALDVDPAGSGPARFTARCEWEVHGSVAHYGHIHRRTNHYRATFGVQHDGTTWRIADIEVLDHERVDPDAEG